MSPFDQNSELFLSIVVPAFNEGNRISPLFFAIEDLLKINKFSFECIIVDDSSIDNTLEVISSNIIIQRLKSAQKCSIITKEKNAGKGEALKSGVAIAKGRYILTLDADIATHPIEILNWFENGKEEIKSDTIYIGSREHRNSTIKSGFIRRSVGRVFNLIVRVITKLNISDTQCGFKLYPCIIGKEIFKDLVNTGWAHDIELLSRAQLKGFKIKEMPITWKSIEGSKISVLKDSIRMLKETIKISRLLKKKNGS